MTTDTIQWLCEALDISSASSRAACLIGCVGAGKSSLATAFACSLLDDGICEGVVEVNMRGAFTPADMMACLGEALDCLPGHAAIVERLRDPSRSVTAQLIVLDNIDDVLVGSAYHSFIDFLREVMAGVPAVKLLLTCRGDSNGRLCPDICLTGLVYKAPVEYDTHTFTRMVSANCGDLTKDDADKIAASCGNNVLLARLAIDAVADGRVTAEAVVQAAASVAIPTVSADGHTMAGVRANALSWLLATVRQHTEVCATVCGPEHMLTLAFMTDMATTHLRLTRQGCNKSEGNNNCIEMLRMLERAADMHTHVLGEEHPLSIRTASLETDCLIDMGMHADAELSLRRQWSLAAKVLGDDHPLTVAVVCSLGRSLAAQGNHSGAASVYGDAIDAMLVVRPWLEDQSRPDGGCSVSTLLASMTLEHATCVAHLGDHVAAAQMLRALGRTASVLKREPGGQVVHMRVTAGLASCLLSDDGTREEALDMCRALPDMEHAACKEVKVAAAYNAVSALAGLLVLRGEDLVAEGIYLHLAKHGSGKQTEPTYRNILDIRQRLLGHDDDSIIHAKINLAGYLAQVKQFDEATELYNDALERYKDMQRPNEILAITQCLAGCRMQQGMWPQATRLYRKAVELAKRNPDMAYMWTATVGLCKCLEHNGNHRDALALYREALDVIAPDVENCDCTSIRISIAACMLAQGDLAEAERELLAVMATAGIHVKRASALLDQCRLAMASALAKVTYLGSYPSWARNFTVHG